MYKKVRSYLDSCDGLLCEAVWCQAIFWGMLVATAAH